MSAISTLARTLIPSEIIKLGNEINDKIRAGEKIYNFTIGDFNPEVFPIPQELEDAIVDAYRNKRTNYPPAAGIMELRQSVSRFINKYQGLDYSPEAFLISGGGRPLIYAAYRTIVDKGDKVIYPVPSWNNNHYTHFVEGEHVMLETSPENNFMPTVEELKPLLSGAVLLALCSPLNPTGTTFTKAQLAQICDLVLEENQRRGKDEKPLYILYDQIYWTLTFGETEHHNPVMLRPELRDYTIFIDGMSKAFCATGVRVGWAFGPQIVIDKMRGILSHIGAWSPMAEQVASAQYLSNETAVANHLTWVRKELIDRLQAIYNGFSEMKAAGLKVDAIAPQAAMYLTIRFELKGMKTAEGKVLETTNDISAYLLNEAKLAVVPFKAFGADENSTWYRLSVGTCKMEDIPAFLAQLKVALEKLS
jgi:aspartate aminotransferase